MSGMYGADIAQLRSLAVQFDRAADQLESCRLAVGGSVRTSPWQGPDAARFRTDWDSTHAGRVAAAASSLRTGAQQLRSNADQQEQASSVDGGAAGGGGLLGGLVGILASASTSPTIPPEGTSPDEVREWWASLSPEQRQQLIEDDPATIGNLHGVPIEDRVAANQITAESRLQQVEDRLAELGDDPPQVNPWHVTYGSGHAEAMRIARWYEERDALLRERPYLESVVSGDRTLVGYDPAADRIIEMIGQPGPGTQEVITYLPGTGADLDGFHSGNTQKVSTYLVQADRSGGTVAFVYKDGPWATWFPWEETSNIDMDFALDNGRQLAVFQDALREEPAFADAQYNGIAHSAGMTSLSVSEVAEARYDRVLSLGGAMLAPGWRPDPNTAYEHYQYGTDAINFANPIGDLPYENSSFENNIFPAEKRSFLGVEFEDPGKNHTRIADDVNNQIALQEMYQDLHSD